jgi:hypothetical protein
MAQGEGPKFKPQSVEKKKQTKNLINTNLKKTKKT